MDLWKEKENGRRGRGICVSDETLRKNREYKERTLELRVWFKEMGKKLLGILQNLGKFE